MTSRASSRRRWGAIGLGLTCLALFVVRSARAEDRPGEPLVDLTWDAPPECPSAASIEAEIARFSAARPSGQPWRASALIVRRGESSWTMHLVTEVEGRRDERDFDATSCAELAATAAVVLAIAVAPSASQGAAPTPTQPLATSQLAEAAKAAPPPWAAPPLRTGGVTRSVEPSSRPVTTGAVRRLLLPPIAFSLATSAAAGITTALAPGATLGVAWLPPRARLELDGTLFPASAVGGSTAETGGAFSLLKASVVACWSPMPGRVRPAACAGVDAGAIGARGTGTRVASTPETAPWIAVQAGAQFVVGVVPHLSARATLAAVVPFLRDSFFIEGSNETIHTPSPVGGEGSLGIEVELR
jgi:hypothetical protein